MGQIQFDLFQGLNFNNLSGERETLSELIVLSDVRTKQFVYGA